jgi:hypothetical protein
MPYAPLASRHTISPGAGECPRGVRWFSPSSCSAWAQLHPRSPRAFGGINVEHELEDYVRRHAYRAVLYTFSEKLARFEGAATPLSAGDAEWRNNPTAETEKVVVAVEFLPK